MPSRRAVLGGGAGLLATGGFASVATFGGSSSDAEGAADRPASVLAAGSLQQVATRIGDADVEAHGSVAARRLLGDGLRDPDAVALADPELFAGVADRVTCFATNALVIAVEESLADAYDDWRDLLDDSELALGRTDPERDPLGYRTVMALRLAERLDAEKVDAAGVDAVDGEEVDATEVDGEKVDAAGTDDERIDAEAVLDRSNVFPETGLLRTLEAGGIDAAVAYRNMAVEHGLPYLELPARVDFSDPALADEYARASVDLEGRTVRGAPIRYAATARTDRGRRWLDRLADAGSTLEDAGFGVPDAYPESREIRTPKRPDR